MELGVKERIVLLGVMPDKGNLATFKMVDELRKKVGLSAEEIEQANLVVEDQQFRWSNEIVKDIEFADKEKELIVKSFKDLEERNELSFQDHAPIYMKFVGED